MIVSNAHRLNRGELPDISNRPEGDFFFFERNSPDDVVQTIKQLVQQRLVGKFGISDPREIQVLTPMNRGPLGDASRSIRNCRRCSIRPGVNCAPAIGSSARATASSSFATTTTSWCSTAIDRARR